MATKDLIVTKSNELINANYKLTLNEQRLLLIALSKVDSRGKAQRQFEVTGQEFSRLTGVSTKDSYDQLYVAANKLFEREISWKEGEDEVRLHLAAQVKLSRNHDGRVQLKWTEEVMPYIGELQSRFTSYKLKHALSLSSAYSIRIFEMLMQFKTTKSRSIRLDDFRSMLKLEKKYPQFKELNKFVIKPAINDINKNTPYLVIFSYSKTGRSVTDLHFDFTENGNFETSEKEIKRAKKIAEDSLGRCKETIDMFGG